MIKDKMTPAFQSAKGGLFSEVEKADIGDTYQKLEQEGVALMGWADPFMPDYILPKEIEDLSSEILRSALSVHYTAPVGNRRLKELIAEKLWRQNNLKVIPERNILITPGSDAGLFYAMLPFIEKGDEVLIPAPSYPNNAQNVHIMGGKAVFVPLQEKDGYQFKREDLDSRLTKRTKMVVLTHPNNPTTTVFSRDTLQNLADFVIENDLILICDQAFEDYCYDGRSMITPASLPGMFERTITVFSFSKGWGLSGYRLGYIVCDDVIMDSLYANAVSVLGATNTAAQEMMVRILEKRMDYREMFQKAFAHRRRMAYQILNSIPGVKMLMPESGFLCWVNVSALGKSADIVQYLLKHAGVAVNDGSNYGEGGEGYIRIVLGVYRDDEKVIDALHRIKKALMELGHEA